MTIVAAACLAGFGFDVRDSSGPVLFDRPVDRFMMRVFDHRVAILLRELGHPKIFLTITAVVAVVLIVLSDYRAAVATVGSVALALVLVEDVFKPFFDRRLAGVSGPTFPSGHTTVAVALAGAVMLAARRRRPLGRLLGPTLRYLLMTIVVIISCAIGPAMVALQAHYTSDVVVGMPLGLAVTGCTAVFLDAFAGRWTRRTLQRDPPARD